MFLIFLNLTIAFLIHVLREETVIPLHLFASLLQIIFTYSISILVDFQAIHLQSTLRDLEQENCCMKPNTSLLLNDS